MTGTETCALCTRPGTVVALLLPLFDDDDEIRSASACRLCEEHRHASLLQILELGKSAPVQESVETPSR